MDQEFRRFVLKGTPAQQADLKKLIRLKGLTREDITLILHTIAFRNQDSDTLAK